MRSCRQWIKQSYPFASARTWAGFWHISDLGSYGVMAWQQGAESHVGQWGTFSFGRGHQLCGLLGTISSVFPIFLNCHSRAGAVPLHSEVQAKACVSVHISRVLLFVGHSSVVQLQKHCFHVLFMTFCSSSMSFLRCWLTWAPEGKPRFSLARPVLGV